MLKQGVKLRTDRVGLIRHLIYAIQAGHAGQEAIADFDSLDRRTWIISILAGFRIDAMFALAVEHGPALAGGMLVDLLFQLLVLEHQPGPHGLIRHLGGGLGDDLAEPGGGKSVLGAQLIP